MTNSVERKRATAFAEMAQQYTDQFNNPLAGEFWAFAMERKVNHGDGSFLEFMTHLTEFPVDIDTFIDSNDFMGSTDLKLWPEVRKSIITTNKYWWKGLNHGAVGEAILAGATGTGKTEQAKVCIAYHLHILGCMKIPQNYWSLPSFTSIVFIIQAAKPNVVKKIIYAPLRKMVEAMPWFQKNLLPDKRLESEMYFIDKNIRVVPGGADDDAILGEAIIGGVIDEINFMAVVQNSKKVQEQTGRSGVYDQAHSVYSAITSRKKGRFLRPGVNIGVIIPSSSTRFVGDYTDRLMTQAIDNDRTDVHIYNKAQFDVAPASRYSGEKFNVQIANGQIADTRILDEHEKPSEGSRIVHIPIEYKEEFQTDIYRALRDICGISDNAVHPFIKRRSAILECIDKGKEIGMEQIVMKENVILGIDGMPNVVPGHYCKNPSKPRYVHVDLSHTSDRCGIGMVRFDGMHELNGENVPYCTVELAISIEPDLDNGIDIAEVRAWIRLLKEQYGYPIKAVSLDNWQSLEFRQQLKKRGVKTCELSVDKTSTPYKLLRDGLYDSRIVLPDNGVLVDELCALEYDQHKDKIDHPPTGFKDCADGVCGAYNLMLNRAATWQDGGRRFSSDRAGANDRRDVKRDEAARG